jgi:plastocyanin
MHSFTTFAGMLLAATATLATPIAPSSTTNPPSATVPLTGVTHTVVAGLGGLRFDPDNVFAEIGDIVQWNFLPKNHSVAKSSFGKPCIPEENGVSFFSGFNFVTNENLAPDVFQIVVEDKTPIWYYCAQGTHCRDRMVGVINQKVDSAFTLAKHRELAAAAPEIVIPIETSGSIIPNPNPGSGF